MKTVTYAIGDIHGRLDLMTQLLGRIERDATQRGARAKIVFTGDYVDRGPDSRAVIDTLIAGPDRPGDEFICLRGNHDELFVQAATALDDLPDWARRLHEHALISYGLRPGHRRPDRAAFLRHVDYLASLPLTHDDGVNLFVHAGVRPGVPLDRQTDQDMLWIRDDFLKFAAPLPRRVVHGHTIMGDQPVVTLNRVSIDTGAYRSGILTAAVFDDGELAFVQAIGAQDKAAIVRELAIVALVRGHDITPDIQQAFDEFVAGDIDSSKLMETVEMLA